MLVALLLAPATALLLPVNVTPGSEEPLEDNDTGAGVVPTATTGINAADIPVVVGVVMGL